MIITLGHSFVCQLMEWVEIDMQEKANGSCPTRGIKPQTSGVLSAVTSYKIWKHGMTSCVIGFLQTSRESKFSLCC